MLNAMHWVEVALVVGGSVLLLNAAFVVLVYFQAPGADRPALAASRIEIESEPKR
jgi:hypothetical protein